MGEKTFPYSANNEQPALRIISVFNLRGGVGKTTLAANLAIAMAQLKNSQVGLMDIALDTLHCSLMLDLKPKAYLSNLADFPEKGINNEILEEMLTRHSSGVALLAAAENPKEAELVTSEMVDLSRQQMIHIFDTIIVDAGSHFNEISLTMLDQSDMIVLVFSPELASVKSTTDAAQILNEIGIPASKVIAVANWIFPAIPILLQRIKPVLKMELAAEIPYDSMAFGKSINTGRPLIIDNPTSAAAEEIRALAKILSEIPV